jgi:hypothetical protein
MMKLELDEIKAQTYPALDVTERIINDIVNLLPPLMTVLTQVDPTHFHGFMGFITNPQYAAGSGGGGVAPPSGYNTTSVTIVSMAFEVPNLGVLVPAGELVQWAIPTTPLSGTVTTDTAGMASVTLLPGSILLGTYQMNWTCILSATPPQAPTAIPQTQTFTVSQ